MAGMNLNPYNLNNTNRTGIRGQDAVSNINDHYAGVNKNVLEDEEEKERQAARDKYFGLFGIERTKPKNIEAEQQAAAPKEKKDYTLYYIGFGIGILIIILIAIFL